MYILEYSEDFGGPEDDFAFQKTIIVYEMSGSIYRAYSRKRYASKEDIQFSDMYSTNKIQGALIFPEFSDKVTKAEKSPECSTWYLKKPSLSPYSPQYPALIRETWIEEVKTCELLKKIDTRISPNTTVAPSSTMAPSEASISQSTMKRIWRE
jgi:hypothetical protein